MATPADSDVLDEGMSFAGDAATRQSRRAQELQVKALEPMRVCFVVSTFPRFEGDPEVPWLLETVRRLRAKGIDVEIFASSYQGMEPHVLEGIPIHRFRYFFRRWEYLTHNEGATNKVQLSPLYKLLALPYIIFGALSMIRFCRGRKFDVFQAHWPFPHALFAWIGARLHGARLSLRFYGAELVLAEKMPFVRSFIRAFMKRADTVDAISTYTASRAREIYQRDFAIIPYGSHLEVSEEAVDPTESSSKLKEILFVGRLVERKGVEYLVRAMPMVCERGVDAHLTVVGNGHWEKEIREAIEAVGAGDLVTMAGRVSDEEKARLYKNCDVYVHPAIVDPRGDTEMLGVVLIEAMAYARPLIASDVGGIPDVVKDGETGLLVPEKNPEKLAEAMVRILTDPALAARLGQAGREFQRSYFDWDRITDSLIAEFRDEDHRHTAEKSS